jgi:hypothetical protein
LKGRLRRITPVTASDRELGRHWHREFSAELKAVGVSPSLIEEWIVEPTVAVEVDVTEVFDQTPGPGAGRKVGP